MINQFQAEETNSLNKLMRALRDLDQVLDTYGGVTASTFMAAAATWNYDPQKDRAYHRIPEIK